MRSKSCGWLHSTDAALCRNMEDKPAFVLLIFNAGKFTNVDIQWFVGDPLAFPFLATMKSWHAVWMLSLLCCSGHGHALCSLTSYLCTTLSNVAAALSSAVAAALDHMRVVCNAAHCRHIASFGGRSQP